MNVSPDLQFASSVWVVLLFTPGLIHLLLLNTGIFQSALDVVTVMLPPFTAAAE